MTRRRFAEDTTVTVGQSQGEARELLKRAGAASIAVYEDDEKHALAFVIEDRQFRITVPIATAAKNLDQEARRTWRLLLLMIKAKIEGIREGASTFEREFLADLVLTDGRTVGEWGKAEIAKVYSSGNMPPLLTGPRRRAG
jgi:hypothetical protein